MRLFAIVIGVWVISLMASEKAIPPDDLLVTFSTRSGMTIGLREQTAETPWVACRFIGQDPFDERPQIFELDCPADLFESELPSFLEYCEEEIQKQGGTVLGVVAVGSIDRVGLEQFLRKKYEGTKASIPRAEKTIQLLPLHPSPEFDLSLRYRSHLSPIQTDADIKRLWTFYLIQSMTETHLKHVATELGGRWLGKDQTTYFLPASITLGRGAEHHWSDPSQSKLLMAFLQTIQAIKERGFNENELSDAKFKLQRNLEHFYQESPDCSKRADYYASCLAAKISYPDYEAFMACSFQLIADIGIKDIVETVQLSFMDETRSVVARFPPTALLTYESIQQLLDHYSSDSIICQEPPKVVFPRAFDLFSELPVTEVEQRMIRQVIQTVARTNPVKLGFMIAELEKKREQLMHIHPLRSLAVFITDPETKQCLEEIMNSMFKRSSFISDFSKRMKQEADKDNLLKYVSGFCQAVRANPDQVRLFIQNKDYEGLIKYLIKLKN